MNTAEKKISDLDLASKQYKTSIESDNKKITILQQLLTSVDKSSNQVRQQLASF